MLANRTANLAVTYPVLCWLYCTTVPIPDFSDNYLGDNYLNCIYNYRYRNLSKLLFLHPSCNGSPPFSCSISKGGESPAPLTIQQSASHNKSNTVAKWWESCKKVNDVGWSELCDQRIKEMKNELIDMDNDVISLTKDDKADDNTDDDSLDTTYATESTDTTSVSVKHNTNNYELN